MTGSASHKAVVQEVVRAGEAVNVSQQQTLALGDALCGNGLDAASAAPHVLHSPPVYYSIPHVVTAAVLRGC